MVAKDLARIYRANSVLTATPGQIVLMLYDSALGALASAREAFALPPRDLHRYETINRHLRRAQRIITELKNTLNFEVGGDVAPTLYRLYEYYNRRILEANMKKEIEPIREVEHLLGDLRDAWAEMLKHPGATRASEAGAVPEEAAQAR